MGFVGMIDLRGLISSRRAYLPYALLAFEASGFVCTRRRVAIATRFVMRSDVQLEVKIMMILHSLQYQVGSLSFMAAFNDSWVEEVDSEACLGLLDSP